MAAAAFFFHDRIRNRREVVTASSGIAKQCGGKADRDRGEGDRVIRDVHQGLRRNEPSYPSFHCCSMYVSQSPFSIAVHSRPSTSLQLRLNHFSTLAGSV